MWGMGTVTGVALNGPFPRVIVSYDAHQRVEGNIEGGLHCGGSMGVADENVTGERAVTLPFIDGSVEGREGGLPDPRRVRSGDGGNKTAFPDKTVIFPTSVRPKGGRIERSDLE